MPELVAPIMPDIAASFRPLARGMAQWAENRRYAQAHELAQQRMAQEAALDQQKFEEARREFAANYSLKQQDLAQTGEINKARADYYKNRLAPLSRLAAQQTMDYNNQTAQLKFDAAQRRQELGLDDPVMQTKNPVAYAAAARRFADEFGTAPVSTGIGAMIGADKRVTDQMKIPLNIGAQYDEAGDIVNQGKRQLYPVLQIVEGLQNPDQSKYFNDALKASGYMKTIPGATHTEGGLNLPYFGNIGGKKVTEKGTTEVGDIIGRYLKQGANVDFSRARSRVPAMMAPTSGAYKGTGQQRQNLQEQLQSVDENAALPEDQSNLYPAATPAAAGPPGPQPTETDQILNQARMALQAGAPLQAIAQRLAAQQIDPRMLFQEQALQGVTQSPRAPGDRFNTAIA